MDFIERMWASSCRSTVNGSEYTKRLKTVMVIYVFTRYCNCLDVVGKSSPQTFWRPYCLQQMDVVVSLSLSIGFLDAFVSSNRARRILQNRLQGAFFSSILLKRTTRVRSASTSPKVYAELLVEAHEFFGVILNFPVAYIRRRMTSVRYWTALWRVTYSSTVHTTSVIGIYFLWQPNMHTLSKFKILLYIAFQNIHRLASLWSS